MLVERVTVKRRIGKKDKGEGEGGGERHFPLSFKYCYPRF